MALYEIQRVIDLSGIAERMLGLPR